MRRLPSYARLVTFLLLGFALVGLGALLKTQHTAVAPWLSIAGLAVQAVAGMMLVYRFAKGFDRGEE